MENNDINRNKLLLEFIILFVLTPIAISLSISTYYKLFILLTDIIYVIYISQRLKLFKRNRLLTVRFKKDFGSIWLRVILVLASTTVLTYYLDKDLLFMVIRRNPLLWISISVFYSVFSVYPQEFIYRLFFFERYKLLFQNKNSMLIFNSIVFSLCHLLFKNGMVLALTLVGGFLFAHTFFKTKSLLFTSLEHSIYGVWIFTLGMGEMLAFPMPE